MNYLAVLEDIGARINDPDLGTYKDRIKAHFLGAINAAIKSGEYSESDYAGYVKLKTDLDFDPNPYDASADLILDIISIYPKTAIKLDCKPIDPSTVAAILRNEEMSPGYEDLFYWRIGSDIYASIGSPSITALETKLNMRYVQDIDDSGWTDSTDMQATANYLSIRIIKAASSIAVVTLEAEIAGE